MAHGKELGGNLSDYMMAVLVFLIEEERELWIKTAMSYQHRSSQIETVPFMAVYGAAGEEEQTAARHAISWAGAIFPEKAALGSRWKVEQVWEISPGKMSQPGETGTIERVRVGGVLLRGYQKTTRRIVATLTDRFDREGHFINTIPAFKDEPNKDLSVDEMVRLNLVDDDRCPGGSTLVNTSNSRPLGLAASGGLSEVDDIDRLYPKESEDTL